MTDDQDAAFIAGADATPVADTPAPPEPEAEKVEAAEPDGEQPEDKADKEAEAEEKPKQTPWFQKRIDELTKARYDAAREADALRQELARITQGGQQQEPGQQQHGDPVEIAKAQIRQEQAVQAFNDRCNSIYEQGASEFPDFEDSLKNFRYLGGLPPVLVQAATETGYAHRILYQLGKNPQEAGRIMNLPPVAMGVALAKMNAQPETVRKPVSAVPPPIKPISGKGEVNKDPDKMNIDEWMKWHDDQEAKKVRR